MRMAAYLRGQIARLANVNPETLRYYENEGLIPRPERSESGYRLYSEDTLERLAFIRNAKACGFKAKEIRKALAKSEEGTGTAEPSWGVAAFLGAIDGKLAALDAEIAEREKTKAMLIGLKANLESADRHPDVDSTLRILRMDR